MIFVVIVKLRGCVLGIVVEMDDFVVKIEFK